MQVFRIETGNGAHVLELGTERGLAVEGGVSHIVLHDGEIHVAGLHQAHIFARGARGLRGDRQSPVAFGGEHLTDGAAQGEVDPGGAAGGQGQAFGIGKSRGGGQNQSAGQNKAENFFHLGILLEQG